MTLHPKIILENGKPKEVILPIEDFEALLEQLEQAEDLQAIREMKQRDWQRVSLDDFLSGRDLGVSD